MGRYKSNWTSYVIEWLDSECHCEPNSHLYPFKLTIALTSLNPLNFLSDMLADMSIACNILKYLVTQYVSSLYALYFSFTGIFYRFMCNQSCRFSSQPSRGLAFQWVGVLFSSKFSDGEGIGMPRQISMTGPYSWPSQIDGLKAQPHPSWLLLIPA